MEGVTDVIKFTPDIDFDDVWESLFCLMFVTQALHRVHRICSSIETDFGSDPNSGWYRIGFLARAEGSYLKWDFTSWVPEEVIR